MKVKEVADSLGVHINTIYNYINTGQMKAERVGGTWEISEKEVQRFKLMSEGTPREAIQSINRSIDLLKNDAEYLSNLLFSIIKKGSNDKSVEEAKDRLDVLVEQQKRFNKIVTAIDVLEQKRTSIIEQVKRGDLKMDEPFREIKDIEYRYSVLKGGEEDE